MDVPTEYEECVVFVEYARWKNIPIIHIPNEGRRTYGYAMQLKKIGLAKGVPDYFIPIKTSKHAGLFIEMKRKKGSKVSEDQEQWLSLLSANGYRAAICYGADAAIEVLDDYIANT